MRRLLAGLTIVALACVPAVAVGATANTTAAVVGISAPITVASNVLGGDGNSSVLAISCARTGPSCGAAGEAQGGSEPVEGFGAEGSGATWGGSIDLTDTFGAVLWAQANAISCPATGSCVAGGYFISGGLLRPWAAAESGGVWGTAFEPAASLDPSGVGQVNAVSCPAVGDCTLIGTYTDTTGYEYAFAQALVNGSWKGPSDVSMPGSSLSDLSAIDCPSTTSCVAVGVEQGAGVEHGYEIGETRGVWGSAGTPASPEERGHGSFLDDVSCASAENCVAVGGVQGDTQFQQFSLVLEEVHGVWHAARVPTPTLFAATSTSVQGVSCPAVKQCTATGTYLAPSDDPEGGSHSFVIDEHTGKWSAPNALANQAHTSYYPPFVSCSKPHDCVAIGTLWHAGKAASEVYAQFESNGVWSPAVEPLLHADGGTGSMAVAGVACSKQGSCEFGGRFTSTPGGFNEAFVQLAQMSPVRVIRSFAAGTATITTGLRRQIVSIAHEIAASKSDDVVVGGYDDGARSARASLRVSSRRAYAVTALLVKYLKALHVTGVTFTTNGFGAADLVQRLSSPHGRAAKDDRVLVLY